MHLEALNKETLAAFKSVSSVPIVRQSYLAGGTALALHFGHRISEDLDFFTQFDFCEDILEEQLKLDWDEVKSFFVGEARSFGGEFLTDEV